MVHSVRIVRTRPTRVSKTRLVRVGIREIYDSPINRIIEKLGPKIEDKGRPRIWVN